MTVLYRKTVRVNDTLLPPWIVGQVIVDEDQTRWTVTSHEYERQGSSFRTVLNLERREEPGQ